MPNIKDQLKAGTLLRIKQHCRRSWDVYMHGQYAVLATPLNSKTARLEVLFPSGHRCLFMPANWEVISDVK